MSQRILIGWTALALAAALCAAACGRKSAGGAVDPKPFETAIADYLQTKNFGMKIARVERIDPQGDTATVVCKMREAEETHAITVTWVFSLRQSAGAWHVETHSAK